MTAIMITEIYAWNFSKRYEICKIIATTMVQVDSLAVFYTQRSCKGTTHFHCSSPVQTSRKSLMQTAATSSILYLAVTNLYTLTYHRFIYDWKKNFDLSLSKFQFYSFNFNTMSSNRSSNHLIEILSFVCSL